MNHAHTTIRRILLIALVIVYPVIASQLEAAVGFTWNTNFGSWAVSNNWVGNNIPTISNSALINNGGTSVLSSSGFASSLTIGNASNNSGTLLISNSGTLTATNVAIGYAGTGSVTVASGGTLISSNITIASSNNSVGILNIGTFGGSDTNVTLNAQTISFGSGSSTVNFNQADTLTISSTFAGTNARTAMIAQLGSGTTIMTGQGGTNNAALVVDGGRLVMSNAVFSTVYGGFNPFAGYVEVGLQGGYYPAFANYSNSVPVSMLITSNSSLACTSLDIGYGYSTTNAVPSGNPSNSLVVNGSTVNVSYLTVGNAGDKNGMLLTNGAVVNSEYGYIGYYGNGNTALVTGSNTLWSNSSDFYLGYSSAVTNAAGQLTGLSNSLVISNGARVNVAGTLYLGCESYTNGNNTVLVTGTNSMLSNSSGIYLGYYEDGDTMIVTNGAKLFGSNDYIGYGGASGNTVTVTGSGSVWSNAGTINVGEGLGNGSVGNSLVISNDGMVSALGYVEVGYTNGDTGNSITVSGTNSKLVVNGSSSDYFDIGYMGSSNSMVVSNGASVVLNSL
jgi:T5SS/PEP-CTERM-associated repeat protein